MSRPDASETPPPGRDVAVVGAGYWGKNLVRNMAQLERLGAIVDGSPAVRERMARAYPQATVTGDLDTVLADPAVTSVMVVVPSGQHFEVASRCLAAGKHTYVEKPICLTVSEGESLCRLAESQDLRLMVGHLLLFHPCVEWVKGALATGELGDVLYMYSERVNLGKVRRDENAMWSLAPHDISVALHLIEDHPTTVSAQGLCYLQKPAGIHDVVFLTMRFADGRAAQVHVSWLDPHKKRKLTVVGSRKMVTFDDMEPAEKLRVYDKGVDRAEPGEQALEYQSYGDLLTLRSGDIHVPHVPMREPLRALCQHWLHCVDTGAEPLTSGRSGVDVLRVLQAGQQSLQAGGVPVALTAHPGGLAGGSS